jgi:hypothetical protein
VTHTESFSAAVTSLLKQLNMELPAEAMSPGEVHTISTGQVDIDLTGPKDGSIVLFCFPGTLPKLHLESLATLLLANRYQEACPPILTSLVGHTVPPKILLWSRLTLADAQANDSALTQLFMRLAQAADDMQSWLDGGLKGGQAESAHIDWLKSQSLPLHSASQRRRL